ncbi:MAG TPA: DUF2269 family protein [Candidatus Limnocylindrales bacterium]|jgi:hypothetical protein
MPATFLPLLLAVHVVLAISLLLPQLLLPFALRAKRATVDSDSRVIRGLLAMQSTGTVVIGVGLGITGLGLVAILGTSLLSQPWLVVGLTIYVLNLVLAFFVQRPRLRLLLGIRAGADDAVWATRARRQRYVSYVMAGLVGTIGFLMSAKPQLW